MSCRWPAVRLTVLLAAAVAALAALPAMALANVTITGGTIDGQSSTSAPPGSVIPATASGTTSGGDTWSGTRYRFGSENATCLDTSNQSGGGTHSINLSVTAPRDPGDYDLGLSGSTSSTCSGGVGAEKVLPTALNVLAPGDNPRLPPRCGINVMLVLDKSGSIQTSGQTDTVRDATRAFLTALSGTGSKVSIVDFSSTAAQPVPYTQVTQTSIDDTFNPYLNNDYKPSGYTNWEAAFQKVYEANANTKNPKADLVVFITDGDPTAHNRSGSNPVTGLTEGDVTAMRPAWEQANNVKAQGSHVFALGVGAAVTKTSSASRLTAISGPDAFPGTDFEDADYTLVQNFDDLAQALRQIATQLCRASVTITKTVDRGNGQYVVDSGWKFGASVEVSPGKFTWVQPEPPLPTDARTQTTGDDGVVTFQWKPSTSEATSTVTLSETTKPGFEFVDATCEITAPGTSGNRVLRRVRGDSGVPQLTLKPGEFAKCTVRNKIIPGTIEIKKSANPQSSKAFSFTGSAPLGSFSLVDDGVDSTKASKVFAGLAPGTYTVNEAVPAGWDLAGIECTPSSAVTISGTQVTIDLASGGSVVCEYTDTKKIVPGTIMITKSASPQSSQPFTFTGSVPLNDFSLVDDGITPSDASKTFTGLTPGIYKVGELVPNGWELVGITCTPANAVAISGAQVTINLQPASAVGCVYQDKRPDTPTPPTPEPPTPPNPTPKPPPTPTPPPIGPEHPGFIAGLRSASLKIVKRAPRVARVGTRVAFSLTVTNTSSVPARQVRVGDMPPAALTLVGLTANLKPRHVNRGVIWRLGTLAPGHSRTIRGTIRIEAGAAGTFRNYTGATALNANAVFAHFDTRILTPPPAPAVTG